MDKPSRKYTADAPRSFDSGAAQQAKTYTCIFCSVHGENKLMLPRRSHHILYLLKGFVMLDSKFGGIEISTAVIIVAEYRSLNIQELLY
jgi:hypothetical protein